MFKKILFIAITQVAMAFSAHATDSDIMGSGTSHYYFLGKIHECLKRELIGDIVNKNEREHMVTITSREYIYNKAKNTLKKIKPQYFDETLDVWLRTSARYEEGIDSIISISDKSVDLMVDECNLLMPYIRLNIVKKPEQGDLDAPDDGNMDDAWKSWEEIK
ncbi:hypothetical protein [Pantoea sp. BAV 3049]|uniref:hypothetical protein n=1 Tax=Pantoea sp. BAV 3049 TaxID=2654188 RepID=UPI00131D6E06|nr:hypothetical protein [Pantoea sp. BAV 3049]